MVDVQVDTFVGLKGAQFMVSPRENPDGVSLNFSIDSNSVYSETQAINDVARRVVDAELNWAIPRDGRWILDLDLLKAQLRSLNAPSWFSGKALVAPRLMIEQQYGFTRDRPKGRVALLILPENVMATPDGVSVFFSYCHANEQYREKLEKHLSVLRRQKLITAWHDRKILPGTEWAPEIDRNLETAQLILLFVTDDFLHSDYCSSVEMTRALERHKTGEARVIPIIVRSCDWKSTPLAALQALPRDGKPVVKWSPRDDAYLDITNGIRRVIEEVQPRPR